MNDEKKGYGIVIPAEWKASDFNGSLDDLFAWIVELDKKAFYRLADAGGIDLELLERAGYEYEGLSFVALNEFENYFKGNSEELAIILTSSMRHPKRRGGQKGASVSCAQGSETLCV